MTVAKENSPVSVIGSTEYVDIASYKGIPAKIDTGADSSSIWASHIRVTKDGILKFHLFDEGNPFYTGKVFKRKDFKAVVIRSSSGHEQIRYRTHFSTKLAGRKIRILFTLSDRHNNNFPVLIGRRSISGKFIVDVSKNHTIVHPKNSKTKLIQKHLSENPYKFHQKYIKKLSGDFKNVKLKEKEPK